ncbi:DUF4159 domain-containing protein [Aquimarina intermedia]|uniref:Uncharacterized protein DUF4159 n=1 Tax=Aquimarina intermedia TaxID=350814 RepID=A0A5S5C725_9FLAO|nr:DUF4159 domain-containing protein [Aquimarina intermedia]TYP74196.1 uncharacterized protein DUF4159 [Aquimarina intermedia]
MKILCSLLFIVSIAIQAQEIAVLHYKGGGDWYSNPTALPNLITFCNKTIGTVIDTKPEVVTPDSSDLYNYPYIHMTGHGNVYFSESEAQNLRAYLMSGGFLHIDDNYGMEPFIRKELIKVFPDKELVNLSPSHPIFSTAFPFKDGLPKIHEHDGSAPQALAIMENNRVVLLFTFESDLGDGWESPEVHNDPEDVRLKALQMGANIIKYAFNY